MSSQSGRPSLFSSGVEELAQDSALELSAEITVAVDPASVARRSDLGCRVPESLLLRVLRQMMP